MSNLIEDIKRAREILRKREADASDAGYTLKMCRAEVLRAQTSLDELLDELVSGQSSFPMFERIERHGSNGTPDEHQRGPTVFPEVQSPEPPKAKKKPAAGLRISTPSPTTGGQVRDSKTTVHQG
jgi:hypothetical protein